MISRKNLFILTGLLAMVILGMLFIGLGLIFAIVIDGQWIYLSLTGALLIVLAVTIVVLEIKRIKRIFKNNLSPEMRELLKRSRRQG